MRFMFAAIFVLTAAVSAFASKPVGLVVQLDDDDPPAGDRVYGEQVAATASSSLCKEKNGKKRCHSPTQMVDGNLATAWCEGTPGDGNGTVLTFSFPKPVPLTALMIVPHFAKNFSIAEQNGRFGRIDVALDGGLSFSVDIRDVVEDVRRNNPVRGPVSEEAMDDCGEDVTCFSRDDRIRRDYEAHFAVHWGHPPKPPAWEFEEVPVLTSKVVMTLRGVHHGTKFRDTCASEIVFYRPIPER